MGGDTPGRLRRLPALSLCDLTDSSHRTEEPGEQTHLTWDRGPLAALQVGSVLGLCLTPPHPEGPPIPRPRHPSHICCHKRPPTV